MKARDTAAVATYRAALSSIDNATAVPLSDSHRAGAVEQAAVGVGAAEVARKQLDDSDIRAIVAADIEDLEQAAEALEGVRAEAADDLRVQAGRLREVLAQSADDSHP